MPQFTEMRRPALWDDDRPSDGPVDRRRPPAPRTVVVGYDGSRAARRALLRAAEAAWPGGHVVVVTATRQPEAVAIEPDMRPTVTDPSRLLEEAAARLAGRGLHVSTRVEEGDPAEALAQTARELHAALIVVGARGDSYLTRALRGSVSEKLIARAPCDLLIAR